METKTIADIVSENFKTADVFKKLQIDFCCGGKKTIAQVCDEKNINMKQLIEELEQQYETNNEVHQYNTWKLSFLIDYIVNVHHQYLHSNLPIIKQYADTVKNVHGNQQPELIEIHAIFCALADELILHLQKEEEILFPRIKQIEENNTNTSNTMPITNPIIVMEEEHNHAGLLLHQLNALTNNYTPPQDACNTYKVFYAKLHELESDLHKHIHLENNLLFPKALKMD